MQTTERIDLHLPPSWNAMATCELEAISSVLLRESARVTKHRPFNTEVAKVEMFFKLTELEVIRPVNPEKPVEAQFYVVRRKHTNVKVLSHLFKAKEELFNIYIWQIHYWIKENMKWMDAPSSLTRFPYPEYQVKFRKFAGPAALMQNFQWRQYRVACDWMSYYLVEQNQLLTMKASDRYSSNDLLKQSKHVDNAKASFLAVIFNRKVRYIDTQTRWMVKEYTYVSNQGVNNAQYFRNFPDEKFQCILFWWTGMMNYLKRKYPKCFKRGEPKNQAQVNPLELYTQTIATMEKYLGFDEKTVNDELFTIVLEQINRMITDNERMDKLNSK